jgi:hypothetical protein
MSQLDQAQYRKNRSQQNRNPRPIPTSGIINNTDEHDDSNHDKQTGNEGMEVGRGVR